jgi:hypothetical protein
MKGRELPKVRNSQEHAVSDTWNFASRHFRSHCVYSFVSLCSFHQGSGYQNLGEGGGGDDQFPVAGRVNGCWWIALMATGNDDLTMKTLIGQNFTQL